MTTNGHRDGSAFTAEQIRNIAFCSHGGAGKTSMAEALLYGAGLTSRLGRTEDGTTVCDFDPDEIKRGITISAAVAPITWRDTKVNILDAPGYADFMGEVASVLRVADGAVILIDTSAGVEVGTEHVWKMATERNLPRLICLNKMDRDNADFSRAVLSVQERFGTAAIPIQIPVGSEKSFSGVIDLLSERALVKQDDRGGHESGPIPAEYVEIAAEARLALVEAIAERDEELMVRYLEDEAISIDELRAALHEAVRAAELFPILCGCATGQVGTMTLLDAMVDLMPAASERAASARSGDTDIELTSDADQPLSALAFKTVADPHVGRVTYLRIYQGTLRSNSHAHNATRDEGERIGQIFHVRGKEHLNVDHAGPGDVVAVSKLASVLTGDSITADGHDLILPDITFPHASYAVAVHPQTKSDMDKLGPALQRIVEEDPTLELTRDPATGEEILHGLGEPHVQIALERMTRRYHVNVELGLPRVAYRETITTKIVSEYKHKKQTGGAGQFGHVYLEIEPLPDEDFVFEEKVVGGSVPRNFYPAVEKGVREALEAGPLAGYPIVNIRVRLTDGSYHAVDSNEMSFKIAAREALKKGVLMARPALLEPVMKLAVTVPEGLVGDIMGDLNSKRAQVSGMNPDASGMTTIEAMVPVAEIQRYATDLRSLTQGRGTFTREFSHYQPAPHHVTEQIRAAHHPEAA